MRFRIEVCVDSIESAIVAQEAGAHRIELCSGLSEGGLTPGFGLISSARHNLDIGLHVLVRPRPSDFLYSDDDYDIMRKDIDFCGEAGADGVVIGILMADGTIDIDRCSRLVEYSRPMSVTFHRAFDLCRAPLDSIRDVISTGADRVLTSGQAQSAIEGAALLSQLLKETRGKIIIMPGGGINESNIRELVEKTGAPEFHFTARSRFHSEMLFKKEGVSMGGANLADEYTRQVADKEKIGSITRILKML
ncbi:MAG: copper homeostasis protein CutC [Bacteroidales bacterium]